MQPTLGLNLKRYLFENFTEELEDTIKNEILTTFKFWLPFVQVQDIKITMGFSCSERNVFFFIFFLPTFSRLVLKFRTSW